MFLEGSFQIGKLPPLECMESKFTRDHSSIYSYKDCKFYILSSSDYGNQEGLRIKMDGNAKDFLYP